MPARGEAALQARWDYGWIPWMADNAQTGSDGRRAFAPEDQGDESVTEDMVIPQHGPVPAQDPAEDSVAEHEFYELRAGGTLVAIEASRGMRPIILYAGPDLPEVAAQDLALLATRQHAPGSASVPLRGSIINEIGTGISGPSGLIAHRVGAALQLLLQRAHFPPFRGQSVLRGLKLFLQFLGS